MGSLSRYFDSVGIYAMYRGHPPADELARLVMNISGFIARMPDRNGLKGTIC